MMSLSPIFLVGFPRSGTTLLGRILGAHEAIVELEEQPLLERAASTLTDWPNARPAAADLEAARLQYVDSAAEVKSDAGDQGERILDRMPINMMHLPLIRTLWPDAPVICLLRHPADVCLSCVMQDFRPNWLTSQFTDLASTVSVYAEVMGLWLEWRELAGGPLLEVRYEDLATDPGNTVESVLQFLDLPVDHQLLQRRHDAKPSGTASYHQVGRAIDTASIGRWRRYEKQLAEFLPRLKPVGKSLGYRDW